MHLRGGRARAAASAAVWMVFFSWGLPVVTTTVAQLPLRLPLLCSFKSLQKRALIEPRRKIEQKKQGKRVEYVHVSLFL